MQMSDVFETNPLRDQLESTTHSALVSVTEPLSDDQIVIARNSGVGIELRFDELLVRGVDLEREALRYGGIALLGTLRESDEGGMWDGGSDDKIAIYQRMAPYIHGYDIELRSPGLPEVVDMARETGRIVIVSSHHFGDYPISVSQLEYRYHTAMETGADYFKVASMAHDFEAAAQLYSFMELNPGAPIIAVTMGELGVEGRKQLLRLGSRATYVFMGDRPAAPGQLSLSEFIEFRAAA